MNFFLPEQLNWEKEKYKFSLTFLGINTFLGSNTDNNKK